MAKPIEDIALECLRLATEFGPETQRIEPLQTANEYLNWVLKFHRENLANARPLRKKV